MPAVGESARTIVDADPVVRDALQQVFTARGYGASAVPTSIDCLALLDRGAKFDLLVIDVIMPPVMPHGFALGRMARHRNSDQKLLYISGYVDSLPSAELETAEAPVLAKRARCRIAGDRTHGAGVGVMFKYQARSWLHRGAGALSLGQLLPCSCTGRLPRAGPM